MDASLKSALDHLYNEEFVFKPRNVDRVIAWTIVVNLHCQRLNILMLDAFDEWQQLHSVELIVV